MLGLSIGLTRLRSGGGLDAAVAALFQAGEQGAHYDPSDFSTMFQDSAGTTPVTAVEQPVGKINDKSGRGNHATQATAASRPVLKRDGNGRYYLLFDGVDDWLATTAINFTATDAITVFAGMRKLSDAAATIPLELSASSDGNAGAFALIVPDGAGLANYHSRFRGTLVSAAAAGGYAAPHSAVITQQGKISTDQNVLRVNGVQAASSVTDQGTGNFGSYPLYIGRRGGTAFPFNGHLYSLVIRGAASSVAQIASGEAYANSKTGAY